MHSTTAIAGERGYYAVGLDIGQEKFWGGEYYTAWKNIDAHTNDICWQKRHVGSIKLSHIYIKKTPEGITTGLANKIIFGDRIAIKKAKKTLSSYYENGKISSGFDGLYITKLEKNKLTIHGFGTRNGKLATTKNIRLDQSNMKKTVINIDKAICEVSATFDFGFGV